MAEKKPEDKHLRSMIFIDASNIYIPAKERGVKIDLFSLRDVLSKKRLVIQTHYFTAVDAKNEKQLRFIRKLRTEGFMVHTTDLLFREKSIYCRLCGQIQKVMCSKCGNAVNLPPHQSKEIDIEIALTLLLTANSYDEAILVSGDRDFLPVIKHLRNSLAKRIVIVSYKEGCAYVYDEDSDDIILLESIEKDVSYPYDVKK
jgi:uncharacterized LabA/DUF88 family protein